MLCFSVFAVTQAVRFVDTEETCDPEYYSLVDQENDRLNFMIHS